MTCDEPRRVVAPSKLDEGGPELLDRSERRYPQKVLLQRANETLGDAIAFGFPNKGGRRFDSEASDFGLKIHGHVIGPVIVAQFQSAGDARGDGAKAAGYRLPNRLQRLETIRRSCGMNANDLRVGVFDGDEHIGLALIRRDRLCPAPIACGSPRRESRTPR